MKSFKLDNDMLRDKISENFNKAIASWPGSWIHTKDSQEKVTGTDKGRGLVTHLTRMKSVSDSPEKHHSWYASKKFRKEQQATKTTEAVAL